MNLLKPGSVALVAVAVLACGAIHTVSAQTITTAVTTAITTAITTDIVIDPNPGTGEPL
jgi:hypothetical protein